MQNQEKKEIKFIKNCDICGVGIESKHQEKLHKEVCHIPLKDTETIKGWEEYAFKGENPEKCEMICDHDIHWCGDCYGCNNCGLRFIPAKWANTKLHSQLSSLQKEVESLRGNDKMSQGEDTVFYETRDKVLQIIKENINRTT